MLKNEHFTIRRSFMLLGWVVICNHEHTLKSANTMRFGKAAWVEDDTTLNYSLDKIRTHLAEAHGVSKEEIDKIF